jgi:4-amino-4-deoxy-L-arabinose transferase-like glycosyltransferase
VDAVLRGLLIARSELPKGFAWFALAIGGGVLAKGPVILLHLLPAALLAPLWSPSSPKMNWKRWYGSILLAFLGGAAIALAWAIPAAISGGEEYQRMIFWGQTANRMVDSFAHKRPFWWYLPLLPLLLFPWLFWPRFWRDLKGLRQPDSGLKLCAVWLLPTFVFFSLISGKQVHYLVPLFPAFAMMTARLTVAPNLRPVVVLAVIAAALFIVAQAAAAQYLWQRYDIQPIAAEIRKLQDQGIPVGNEGFYHAQYQFAGRLEHPIQQVEKARIAAWFEKHPDGRLIYYTAKPGDTPAHFAQRYQSEFVLLLDREQARARGLIK